MKFMIQIEFNTLNEYLKIEGYLFKNGITTDRNWDWDFRIKNYVYIVDNYFGVTKHRFNNTSLYLSFEDFKFDLDYKTYAYNELTKSIHNPMTNHYKRIFLIRERNKL